MSFDVFGPTRHVRASNEEAGSGPRYDILVMPGEYGVHCPQIENLGRRFYESTTLCFDHGTVHALRDELIRLREAYRARREPDLILERRVRARDPEVRRTVVDQLLHEDVVFRVLEELRLLCEEAIAAKTDVRCIGD